MKSVYRKWSRTYQQKNYIYFCMNSLYIISSIYFSNLFCPLSSLDIHEVLVTYWTKYSPVASVPSVRVCSPVRPHKETWEHVLGNNLSEN